MIRRHRLLEPFLTRVLGLDWSEVDAEAEELEHAASPRLEQALAAYLGEPLEDPHGHPIPRPDGTLKQRPLQPLCHFSPGQSVLIREAEDHDPERLRRWQALGLLPGRTVHILSFQPLDDLFQLQIETRIVPMSSEGLAGLRGKAARVLAEKQVAWIWVFLSKVRRLGLSTKNRRTRQDWPTRRFVYYARSLAERSFSRIDRRL